MSASGGERGASPVGLLACGVEAFVVGVSDDRCGVPTIFLKSFDSPASDPGATLLDRNGVETSPTKISFYFLRG